MYVVTKLNKCNHKFIYIPQTHADTKWISSDVLLKASEINIAITLYLCISNLQISSTRYQMNLLSITFYVESQFFINDYVDISVSIVMTLSQADKYLSIVIL